MTPKTAAVLFNKWDEYISDTRESLKELTALKFDQSESRTLDALDAYRFARKAQETFENENRTVLDEAGDILSELTQNERAELGLK